MGSGTGSEKPAALVLAHGAFHGPWCWQPLMERLERDGTLCVAVDLNRGGLAKDAEALQQSVDLLRHEGHRVHAIGHSLGCPPVSWLDPESVATAIFLAGPLEGGGLPDSADCVDEAFPKRLQPQPDGRFFISREDAHEAFYLRCRRDEAEWALDRLRPTFVYGAKATTVPIWEKVPATYVVCTDDGAVRPDYQRGVAEGLPHSATIDFDHSPMLGAADRLAEIVREAMARAD